MFARDLCHSVPRARGETIETEAFGNHKPKERSLNVKTGSQTP